MPNRHFILSLCLLFLVIAAVPAAERPPADGVSHFTNLNAPGAIETDPFALNGKRFIAGDYVDKKNIQHGMILKDAKLTSVDRKDCTSTPGPGAIAFYGINSEEIVVGWCLDTKTGVDDAFSYFKRKFVIISPPGATSTQANGINDNGQIVGSYVDSGGVRHGFVLSGGQYTTLDVPGETNTEATDINIKGLITLFALSSGGTHDSYLLNGEGYTQIDVPNETSSFVEKIDSDGDRIYSVLDSSNNAHGAFFLNVKGGQYFVFDDPKGTGTTHAFGLNDKLKIVGRYAPLSPSGPTEQGFEAVGCCRPGSR